MKYDFDDINSCNDSIKHFTGEVSSRSKVIGKYLDEILKKEGVKPKRFIGHKITQFSELYPEEEELISKMRWFSKIRNILEHGDIERIYKNENDLKGVLRATLNGKREMVIDNKLVDKFQDTYIYVHNSLLEFKS